MKLVWLSLSALGLLLAIAAPAQADCQCVAEGKRFHLGEVACLSLPQGRQLARCSMVLNNSSWTKLEDSCPLAFNDSAAFSEPLSVASGHAQDHDHSADRVLKARDH
jgi:hypothetical protein